MAAQSTSTKRGLARAAAAKTEPAEPALVGNVAKTATSCCLVACGQRHSSLPIRFLRQELMHYKLLGFSQNGAVRTYRFHRIGVLGTAPVPFTVLADTDVARQHNVTLQELPT